MVLAYLWERRQIRKGWKKGFQEGLALGFEEGLDGTVSDHEKPEPALRGETIPVTYEPRLFLGQLGGHIVFGVGYQQDEELLRWANAYRENFVKGYNDGVKRANRRWREWVRRRELAQAQGEPFNEPMPGN